ncbi:filamentous hemagglutinin N-terminal domain-containing protein [Coleofasciculus sp. FACHB-SPT9]|nr:filamentous hemagglutinin N-terminal domain-containing protein [Coleofasciculus sp. FACHB-SPT9]MBD1890609.1 filamentous hemagglutinin N-terminal domain-containing protein [Coleofasciculus sp. FACHB-SPT9]
MTGAIAFSGTGAFAQVTPDPSLGTVVTPNGTTLEITGGTTAGDTNLFHSFENFSIPNGGIADFLNAPAIANILARVTGGSPSDIQGLIRARGNANLFLINPNGIIFGPNAQLDIGGSFVATTANAIAFSGDGEFSQTSAVDSQNPLLSVNPSAFLFNQIAAQPLNSIEVRGNLAVLENRNLLLVGGNLFPDTTSTGGILIDGGALTAPGGRVELSGVTLGRTVGLNFEGNNNPRLSSLDGVTRTAISLINGADVNVTSGGGGSIVIDAGNLNVLGGSSISAGIGEGLGSASSQAGDITLKATEVITIADRSGIYNNVEEEAVGNAGNINIRTGSLSITNGAGLYTSSAGRGGNAGSVTINARDRVSFNRGYASTSVEESETVGNAGNIDITTGSLSVMNGAQLLSLTHGRGHAGSVNINARDTVVFDGMGSKNGVQSAVFSTVERGAVGNGGSINIITGSLSVTNGARLIASTRGQGSAGSVNIDARDTVSFDGVDEENSQFIPSGAFSTVERTNNTNAVGNSGGINIKTRLLSVTNGAQLEALTRGQGNAGSVNINARDRVSFDGVGREGKFQSAALSTVEDTSVGNSSGINITTGLLALTNGALLSASTTGQGNGGNITLNVNTLEALNGGQVVTTSRSSGKAGDITLNVADSVTLSGSDATYFAKIAQFGKYVVEGAGPASGLFANTYRDRGNGGNITIQARLLFVTDGAVVTASAVGMGQAGSVIVKKADTVLIDGQSQGGSPSQVSADTQGSGTAGDVIINTRQLIVNNGAQASAFTESTGNAGTLEVNATESVTVGKDSGLYFDSRSSGDARGIRINTGRLVVQNGGQVTVSGTGTGNPGDLEVAAGSIFLNTGGKLTTEIASGNGGNIRLQVRNQILMRYNSLISASAVGPGNGGNIEIEAPNGFVLAFLSENSDIVASANQGNGGKSRATATGVFGFRQFRDRRTPESDFTASSELGIDGTLEINTRDRQLEELPAEFANVEISQVCQTSGRPDQSEFVVTGRGGLPPNPGEVLNSDAVQVDLVTLNPRIENRSIPPQATNPTRPTPVPLVEAQGWVRGANGKVVLTANAPTVTPHRSWQRPPECSALQSNSKL